MPRKVLRSVTLVQCALLLAGNAAWAQSWGGTYGDSKSYANESGYDTNPNQIPLPPEEQEQQKQNEIMKGDENSKVPLQKVEAEGDVDKWFEKYDDMRCDLEMTPQERQRVAYLFKRNPNNMTDDDQRFLQNLQKRYEECIDRLRRMTSMPETMRLHRGHLDYVTEWLTMFTFYLQVRNDPNSVDPHTGAPITEAFSHHLAIINSMEMTNRALDQQAREYFKIDKDPLETGYRRQRQQQMQQGDLPQDYEASRFSGDNNGEPDDPGQNYQRRFEKSEERKQQEEQQKLPGLPF